MNAIVLTGGTSKRFGSDKSLATIGGESLIEILVQNLKEYELIIVGPELNLNARFVREEPKHAGPLAAIGAGLEFVQSDLVAIFATDMPFAPKLINQLLSELTRDAALPVDKDGQVQPLAGIYRTERLRRALAEYESLKDQSVKSMLSKLDINLVSKVNPDFLIDIDTVEDLAQASKLQSRFAQ